MRYIYLFLILFLTTNSCIVKNHKAGKTINTIVYNDVQKRNSQSFKTNELTLYINGDTLRWGIEGEPFFLKLNGDSIFLTYKEKGKYVTTVQYSLAKTDTILSNDLINDLEAFYGYSMFIGDTLIQRESGTISCYVFKTINIKGFNATTRNKKSSIWLIDKNSLTPYSVDFLYYKGNIIDTTQYRKISINR